MNAANVAHYLMDKYCPSLIRSILVDEETFFKILKQTEMMNITALVFLF